MKRKLFGAVLLVALAVTAGWNFNQSENETKLNDLGLANMEALANSEGCTNRPGQNNGKCVTNGNGDYFCANSTSSYDCVK